MIELPPVSQYKNPQIMELVLEPVFQRLCAEIEKDYLYWDKAKYHFPQKERELYWAALRYRRFINSASLEFGGYHFTFPYGDYFLKTLHEFDMDFGGSLVSSGLLQDRNKRVYRLSSIMEEAIASSQMEGANTTRKVAKEILRKQAKPKDKSQQMIVNNYHTINFLLTQKDEPLSKELLLHIHSLISRNTLENPAEEGAFRTTDDIVVQDSISGDIAHVPPKASELPELIDTLIGFANTESGDVFIHPIIKAIILHFLVSFLHPFTDGNGRTARSLVYWYLLKKGYWLTEYLSISRIICKSKTQYENSFLYTENDNMDLGYFIHYNLKVMKRSYEELTAYLKRKLDEQRDVMLFQGIEGINERQARILRIALEKPETIFVSKELETQFTVSVKTLRSDLQGLVAKNLLKEVALNKRLVGYTRSEDFDRLVGLGQ